MNVVSCIPSSPGVSATQRGHGLDTPDGMWGAPTFLRGLPLDSILSLLSSP